MKHLPGEALGIRKFPILNVLSLLAISFIISGCFWSGPWPRVDLNIEGLGEGELARFVGRHTNYGADGLKQRTTKFIIEQTPPRASLATKHKLLVCSAPRRPAGSAAIRANTGFEATSDMSRAMVPITERDHFIMSTCGSPA